MKICKRMMLGLTIVCLLVATVPAQALASIPEKTDCFKELFGIAGKEYDTEAAPYFAERLGVSQVKSIILSNDKVFLEHNGASEFVDVIGELESGGFANITNAAEWTSENPDIVFADAGRILAMAPGETTIIVEYGDHKKTINVSVLGSLDIAAEIDRLNELQPEQSSYGFTATERTSIIKKAKGMVELEWTPTEDIRGWKKRTTFKAKTKYTGIPYSQTEYQKDSAGFNKALKADDFYEDYTRFDIVMPKYGSDCSGFVCFSWGISRKTTSALVSGISKDTYAKVGSYDATSPTEDDLKKAYEDLKKADAVVKNGHTFIIASNDSTNSKVYAYEQTPYYAQYTSWTYSTMAKSGYMPFTKK